MLLGKFLRSVLILGALCVPFGISGCGGGGGGGGGDGGDGGGGGGGGSGGSGGGGGSSSGSYLFYSGSISAVDPATPASPITVEAGTDIVADSETSVLAGTYDAATKTFNDIHTYAIVYAKTDGKLYKVSALKSSGTPTPTQLSSETAADKICGKQIQGGISFENPDHAHLFYTLPGANATCYDGDDVYKMVRLGMSAADAPVTTTKKPVADLFDSTTGALSGWLVNDAGALKRCDANFANCGASLKSIASYAYEDDDSLPGTNPRMLEIDNALYVYDGDSNTLSASIYSGRVLDMGDVQRDASNFYFTSGTSKSIYSAPIDGSAAATPLVTDTADIEKILISANKLVYWTATEIKAVAKTGGAAITLATGNGLFRFMLVTGNHIYYTTYSTTGVPTAGVIDDDGSNKSETANAMWVGATFGTSWSRADNFLNIVGTVIRAEGYEMQGAGKGFAGGTLHSFNAASTAEVAVLGTLPTDVTGIYCLSFGAGTNMLCRGSSTTQSDVFFLNTDTAGSLVRVTNTPMKNESPL